MLNLSKAKGKLKHFLVTWIKLRFKTIDRKLKEFIREGKRRTLEENRIVQGVGIENERKYGFI